MSRIPAVFHRLSLQKEKALITYLMAGDPTLSQTADMVLAMEKAGADLIELGVPFSDPVADGPVIARAASRALAQGVSLQDVLGLVARLRRQSQIPLILMTYVNPVYAVGLVPFFREAQAVGVDGIIIPDLPIEEASEFVALSRCHDIDLVFLVTPTTEALRIQKIVKSGSGFIYYVSLTGITGAPLIEKKGLRGQIRKIKSKTDLPVAVGFGIATPGEAREVARDAEGVIVGSALVKIIETAQENPAFVEALAAAVSSFKKAISA